MNLQKHQISGVDITINSKNEILEHIDGFFKSCNQFLTIVTPNPEQIMLARKDKVFREILNRADIAIPDGIGIVWAMKRFYHRSIERISGIDFMVDLLRYAETQKIPVAFLGGKENVAVKAFECQKERFPKLQGFAEEMGEIDLTSSQITVDNSKKMKNFIPSTMSDDKQEEIFHGVAEKIVKEGIGMVFIALGMGKQERVADVIKQHISSIIETRSMKQTKLQPVLFMSIGGAFDMLSGRIKRAPEFVRSIGLEWFWRLVFEPWRWKRQLELMKYILMIYKGGK